MAFQRKKDKKTVTNQKKNHQNFAHPHDLGFKHLLSHKELFKQLLEGYVEGSWKKDLDYHRAEKIQTSYISPEFEKRESDIIYKVPLKRGEKKEVYLYILIEHQSTVDYSIPFRILSYLMDLWRDIFKNMEESQRKSKDFRLPPVFPIVLYNGDREWKVARSLREIIECGDLFGEFVPNVRYSLVDIGKLDDQEILVKKNAFASVLFWEKHLGEKKVKELWDELWNVFEKEDHILLEGILRWLYMQMLRKGLDESDIGKINFKTIKLEEGKKMIQTQLDKLEERCRQEGMEKGMEKGMNKALQESVLSVLESRFHLCPLRVKEKIYETHSPEMLHKLIKKVAVISSVEEFKKLLGL